MAEFLTEPGKAALLEAVREIEAQSAAEVVITVRTQSGSYLHADLLCALLSSFITLAFLLYSPWPFSHHWLLIDPFLIAACAGWFSRRTPAVRRWLSTREHMRSAVEREARAAFLDKNVCETDGRTGLLIYVSQLERESVIVSDRAVQSAVDASFAAQVQALAAQVAAGCDALALANALRGLAGPLARALPRGAEDVNELGDQVHA
jgi:putative membrane protein